METKRFNDRFTPDILKKLFPIDRSGQFFDALFGDATEGAYDIVWNSRNTAKTNYSLSFTSSSGQANVCFVVSPMDYQACSRVIQLLISRG